MVDKNDVILEIKFIFEGKEKTLKLKEILTKDKLVNKAIEQFGIPKEQKKNISINYRDEEEYLCPLEDNENIFDLSKEKSENLYYLELVLELHEQKELVEADRREDENNEEDLELDRLKNQLENKNKDYEKLKKELENKNKENEEKNKDYEKLKKELEIKERKIEELKNEMNKKKDKKNKIIMDNKENERLNGIIEQMKNKIKVLELEKQIEEIRNRKEQKRKNEEEKKIMELINNHEKVENLRKQKEELELYFLYNKMMSSIEKIIQNQNKSFNERIKKFEEKILSNNKINIDENQSQIIQKNNDELDNKITNINNYLNEINDQIISIEKGIKAFKEYQNKILKEKTESIIKEGIKKDNNSLNKDSNNTNPENLINDIVKKSSKDINNNNNYLKQFLEEYCYHQNKMDDSILQQLYVTLKDKGIQEPYEEVKKAYYKYISPNFKKNNIDENGRREIENRISHIKKLFTNLNEKKH